MPGNQDYEDLDNFPAKDWEEGEFCAVCHNGGEFVGCERCPRVYHLECYIPELTAEPADGWICLLCRTKKEFEKLSNDSVRLGGNMAKRDRQVCVRLLFEVYNVYPESTSFKSVKALDFHQYRAVINKPIALDVIKSKLDIDHTDAYMSVADFVSDVRLMFQNCRTFWKTFTGGDIYIEHATNLWSNFEKLWKDWKALTSHSTAPAFIIAPYEKKKPVSHNNFPKVGRGKKEADKQASSGQARAFLESPRKPGPASLKRPGPASSKAYEGLDTKRRLKKDESDPLSIEDAEADTESWQCNDFNGSAVKNIKKDKMSRGRDISIKGKQKSKYEESSDDETSSHRDKHKNERKTIDYNNNDEDELRNNGKAKKKKRSVNDDGSAEESEDDYDPRDDERDMDKRGRKKNKNRLDKIRIDDQRISSKSSKEKKNRRLNDSDSAHSSDEDDGRLGGRKPGPASSKRPGPASTKRSDKGRDSEGGSESEDNYQPKSDKLQKKRGKFGELESEDNYEEFASPEFADLPMN